MQKKATELTPELFITYKQRGMTNAQIGRMFDCGYTTISNRVREMGLDPAMKSDEKKKIKQFKRFYHEGYDHRTIAKMMDMSRGALSRFKKKHNLNYKPYPKWITPEQIQTAKDNGLTMDVVYHRYHKMGWDIDSAVKTPKQPRGGNKRGLKCENHTT